MKKNKLTIETQAQFDALVRNGELRHNGILILKCDIKTTATITVTNGYVDARGQLQCGELNGDFV